MVVVVVVEVTAMVEQVVVMALLDQVVVAVVRVPISVWGEVTGQVNHLHLVMVRYYSQNHPLDCIHNQPVQQWASQTRDPELAVVVDSVAVDRLALQTL